jgi:dipeptidyl-peptidase-4
MNTERLPVRSARLAAGLGLVLLFGAAFFPVGTGAQDRLKSMPGYARYQKMQPLIASALRTGSISVAWSEDGKSFEYAWRGRQYRFDVESRRASDVGAALGLVGRIGRGGRGAPGAPERGRQFAYADSPDQRLRAQYRESDRNLILIDRESKTETQITTDGSREKRIKYGTASWVYGEELDQTTAMWWSPDSRKLAFYRFDESSVPDYYLQLDQTRIQSTMDVEAYPKAGAPNPVVDLLIYDVRTRRTTKVDVRNGRPFEDDVPGHYAYHVAWSPDGRELLFNRTNRRQNVLEFVAADPSTGEARVVIREEWPDSWVENIPAMVFLEDGHRFIWQSERNGWSNFYLYDLSGRLLNPITTHRSFEAVSLVKVDERAGLVFYTARDGDNHLKVQLHRVRLDGTGDTRLTDPRFHHTVGSCLSTPGASAFGGRSSCGISPDNRFFVDVYQAHDVPPATRMVDAETGAVVAEIVDSDASRYEELGLRTAELFTFPAADGRTTLYGLIQFPSDFDPARKYPVLVPVYGGPGWSTGTARETFVAADPLTEYGALIVHLDTRSAPGRGKRVLDQVYMKLGQVEVDDVAEGIRALASRPYVDASRVGIYGTSYGGYVALMSLLRYPDVFAAASASSPVTSWQHYDTIYTERYMRTPQENPRGYDAGSALTYAANLKGRLMLYYGTADNNVHPSNMMQLVDALQAAGKSFDLQVGPDRGHTGINTDRMMEFFIEHVLAKPAAVPVAH